jgi:tRNA pseudouridine38-40 synthase
MSEDMSKAADKSVALTVAYDGSPFHGFARQPGLETVQGRLERALQTALRRPVETTGAGRTDAGVHALGQVVSFDGADGDPEPDRIRRSVTALAGPGVVVREVRLARPGFSARFDAVSREYRYRITTGPVPALFLSQVAWHVPSALDVDVMRSEARELVGEHDFKSFCLSQSAEGQSTMRRVDEISVGEEEHLGEECLTVTVKGNAFLHSMVRIIVGSLVESGSGQRPAGWMAEALAACDRTAAGQTAPPHGLTLWRVEYPDEVWLL